MPSYMSTTFSFKGFLEDDVLLSKPAFFSTWDMTVVWGETVDTQLTFDTDREAKTGADVGLAAGMKWTVVVEELKVV